MPTYVYRRPDGTTFEVFQKISDDALRQDPETGVPVQRVISGGAGLQFKGDGFYITDYVKKSGAKGDGGDTSSAKKGEAKTEAAPAKASETTNSSKAPSSNGSASSADGK